MAGPITVCVPEPILYFNCNCGYSDRLGENCRRRAIKSFDSKEPRNAMLRRFESGRRVVEKSRVIDKSILFHDSSDMCGGMGNSIKE